MFEYIKDITTFNPDLFHFLRPEWLWAFIPMVLIAVLILFTSRENKKWKKIIAPALHGFMFTKEKRSGVTFPLFAFILIMSLVILSVSGPTWEKEEIPGTKSEAVLMIALDVSLSMLAEDIQPNRLERAKFKIRDLLKANPGTRVSLYVYAGTAHTVIPLCSDYNIIIHHLESLSPGIMPVRGSNLPMLMEMADSVFSHVTAPSTLLIVTDVIKEEAVNLLELFVNNSLHNIEILAMATQQGATIPENDKGKFVTDENGNLVVSKLNTEILFNLQKHKKINVNSLTLDNSDMELMATKIRKKLAFQEDDEKSDEQWKDIGFVLVILLVLVLPFWFRKGWMIQYSWIPLLFFMSSCTGSFTWENMWNSPDYQAQKLYNQEKFEEAGETFESSFHQGVAFYKAGNFDAAAQAFAQDSSTNSLFNLGMAYTQMGRYDEALKVIALASEKDPGNKNFKDAMEQTNEILMLVDSLRKSGEPIFLPEKDEEEKEELAERKAVGEDERLSDETEVEELPEDGKRVTEEVETDQRKAEEMEEVPDDFQSQTGEAPQNVLLRGISEDPAVFLKRRFKFQQKKYHQDLKEMKEKW